ncbi:hypothetical protein [Butyrivibrio proteoclasticus]|uniref:hypothetical protein n=1 Tax=Butyrivibrio proteoclasticus TaxID=43305 RepID=UPI0004791845|nr:hypothetical protein [Butyrivibrio proteoclasticus]
MDKVITQDALKRYRYNTRFLCLWLRELQLFADKREAGKEINQGMFAYACKKCTFYKAEFLKCKEELGYNDKFSFLEDNHFIGFSIINGKFVGDVSDSQINAITDKWYYGFPERANHYQYEVGCYVDTMSEKRDFTNWLYKDYLNASN